MDTDLNHLDNKEERHRQWGNHKQEGSKSHTFGKNSRALIASWNKRQYFFIFLMWKIMVLKQFVSQFLSLFIKENTLLLEHFILLAKPVFPITINWFLDIWYIHSHFNIIYLFMDINLDTYLRIFTKKTYIWFWTFVINQIADKFQLVDYEQDLEHELDRYTPTIVSLISHKTFLSVKNLSLYLKWIMVCLN